MAKIGIIGGGNMGCAILQSLSRSNKVVVAEKNKARAKGLRKKFKVSLKTVEGLVKETDIIILAVKPQDIHFVLDIVKKGLTKRKLVISIAAGITTSFIERKLGGKARVVRTMPNMPAIIEEGITAVSKGKYATQKDVLTAGRIFQCIGQTVSVNEKHIDAITAVSGSGPAYVFYFVECLLKAARSLGLDKALSEKLVYQTLLGSSHLLTQSRFSAEELRIKVTSKGGTTQAALKVLTGEKINKIYGSALKAAKQRAKQLSRR